MITRKPTDAPGPDVHHAPAPASLDDLVCYFEGAFVPMRDAKVSIMTHAFMYGTATFEGIRAYWNEEQGRLYGLKIREHVEPGHRGPPARPRPAAVHHHAAIRQLHRYRGGRARHDLVVASERG